MYCILSINKENSVIRAVISFTCNQHVDLNSWINESTVQFTAVSTPSDSCIIPCLSFEQSNSPVEYYATLNFSILRLQKWYIYKLNPGEIRGCRAIFSINLKHITSLNFQYLQINEQITNQRKSVVYIHITFDCWLGQSIFYRLQ